MQEIQKILGHFNAFKIIIKDGILQEVISIWMQLCSVAHFSVIKIRMGAISSAVRNYFFQNTIFRKPATFAIGISLLSAFF